MRTVFWRKNAGQDPKIQGNPVNTGHLAILFYQVYRMGVSCNGIDVEIWEKVGKKSSSNNFFCIYFENTVWEDIKS